MLARLLAALPEAASSSYALIAYVLVAGTIAYVTSSGRRLRSITRIIQQIPEQDRLKILSKEYNVTPKEGLSAEDWLRSQAQMLFFWLALAVLVAFVLLTVIAAHESGAKAAERQNTLVSFWKEEQAHYENLLRNGTISEANYTSIVVSLNTLSTKIADPTRAVNDYVEATADVVKDLKNSKSILSPQDLKSVAASLEKGLPTEAKAILEQAAQKDISGAADKYFQLGRISEQEANVIDAVKWYEKAFAVDNTNAIYFESAISLNVTIGKFARAQALLDSYVSSNAPLTDLQSSRAEAWQAFLNLNQNKFKEAELIYKRIITKHSENASQEDVSYGFVLNNFGSMYQNMGKYELAEPYIRLSLKVLNEKLGTSDPEVGKVKNNLGYLMTVRGRFEEALLLLEGAKGSFVAKYGQKNAYLIDPYNNLGRYFTAIKHFEEAESYLTGSLGISQLYFVGKHPHTGRTYDLIFDLMFKQQKFNGACEAAGKSMEIKSLYYDKNNVEIGISTGRVGLCLLYATPRDVKGGLAKLKEAVDLIGGNLGSDNVRYAEVAVWYGQALALNKKISEAKKVLKSNITILSRDLGVENSTTKDALAALAQLELKK